MYIQIHVHTDKDTCTYRYMYIQIHVHTDKDTCTYRYMYIQINIHVHTRVERFARFRVISREALARGDIARDPARSRQISWLRVRLREMMEWRDVAGLCAISRAYN